MGLIDRLALQNREKKLRTLERTKSMGTTFQPKESYEKDSANLHEDDEPIDPQGIVPALIATEGDITSPPPVRVLKNPNAVSTPPRRPPCSAALPPNHAGSQLRVKFSPPPSRASTGSNQAPHPSPTPIEADDPKTPRQVPQSSSARRLGALSPTHLAPSDLSLPTPRMAGHRVPSVPRTGSDRAAVTKEGAASTAPSNTQVTQGPFPGGTVHATGGDPSSTVQHSGRSSRVRSRGTSRKSRGASKPQAAPPQPTGGVQTSKWARKATCSSAQSARIFLAPSGPLDPGKVQSTSRGPRAIPTATPLDPRKAPLLKKLQPRLAPASPPSAPSVSAQSSGTGMRFSDLGKGPENPDGAVKACWSKVRAIFKL